MAAAQPTIAGIYQVRPAVAFNTALTIPYDTDRDGDGRGITQGLLQVVIPLILFLDTVHDENAPVNARSAEDRLNVFTALERGINAAGIDGKSCLLRAICEIQTFPIGDYSLLGELLTVLLTPTRSPNDFLHDYVHAESMGRATNASCLEQYDCPVSIFNLFNSSRRPQQEYSYLNDNTVY